VADSGPDFARLPPTLQQLAGLVVEKFDSSVSVTAPTAARVNGSAIADVPSLAVVCHDPHPSISRRHQLRTGRNPTNVSLDSGAE
jgi:hypothetical protein